MLSASHAPPRHKAGPFVLEIDMQVHTGHRSPVSATLTVAAMLCFTGPAAAQILVLDPDDIMFSRNPPPSLLQFASSEPTLRSSASAMSTYQGSLRFTPCSDSGAFWACRELIDKRWTDDPDNRVSALVSDTSMASAERRASAFDYTEATPQINYSVFADITPATSHARARTDYGSNKAEAAAWNARSWTETRVQSAWDPEQSSITGYSQSSATASSIYTEVLTPDQDGQIILNFALEQHAGSGRPPMQGPGYDDLFSGDARGTLRVQVFNLDETIEYSWGEDFETRRTQEGFAIVGKDSTGRDGDEGPGTSFMSLAFDVVAGHRYSLVSALSVGADNNASADFYGTASLERILVTPGMTLTIGSGTTYAVATIPEPQTYAMLLAGLGVLGWVARRRPRA